jgi:hypothetical protein
MKNQEKIKKILLISRLGGVKLPANANVCGKIG